MRIIPAIYIINGKCVRLTQGDYSTQKVYNDNPVDVAKQFEAAGIKYLHLVDLDGAREGQVVNWKTVEGVITNTNLAVDFGGGVKSEEEVTRLFESGVRQVNIGSLAVKKKEIAFEWLKRFGADKIIISADVKHETIAINGWESDSGINILDFLAEYSTQGMKYTTCTDISVDGMLTGPSIDLYRKLLARFPTLNLVASGGVSSVDDLMKLQAIGVDGVIIGKAIYEGRIKLSELKPWLD
jgi:phosphoribosylformimino-5-aminoimidazole carboxamide ribotide isomerase